MTWNSRLWTIAGTGLAAVALVSCVGAAMQTGKTNGSSGAAVTTDRNTRNVVCFGYVDTPSKVLQVFPRDFPQPVVVSEVKVNEGDIVEAGQVLIVLDKEALELKVKEAKAGLGKAEAAVVTYQTKLAQAQEGVTLKDYLFAPKEAEAKAMFKKFEQAKERLEQANFLKEKQQVGEREVKLATLDAEAAREAYEGLRIAVEGLKKVDPALKVKEAEAGVAEARAAVEYVKQQISQVEYALANTVIKAPMAGIVARLDVCKGTTVGMQTKAPLALLIPKEKYIVRAEVEQEFASRVKVGQTATIVDDADPKITFTGKVDRIAVGFLPKRNPNNPLDFNMNDSRVQEVLLTIDGAQDGLRIGQKMKVRIGD